LRDAAGDKVAFCACFGGERREVARAIHEGREPLLRVLDEIKVVDQAALLLCHVIGCGEELAFRLAEDFEGVVAEIEEEGFAAWVNA